jgi:palmitoyltransferase
VNATDHAGQTALHWAAVRGSTSVADVLMEHGARVEVADVNGYRVMRRLFHSGFTARFFFAHFLGYWV